MADFSSKYGIGDFVRLVTDVDNRKRIITRMMVSDSGIEYSVRYGDHEASWHGQNEIAKYRGRSRVAGFNKQR